MSGTGRLAVIAIALCIALPAVPARADTPWSDGVSKAEQKRAFQLFDAGNKLFEQGKYADALPLYEKAIQHWDHPAIEFNVAVCFINIRQPLDAWDHLARAMNYGEAPVGKRVWNQALTYRELLESSLAQLEVSSDQDDVAIMLDGRELLAGKGDKKIHALPGAHQLVATRPNYRTESQALDLIAGKTARVAVRLELESVRVEIQRENYERRWKWWIPWTTVAGGVAFALAGTGAYLAARSDMRSYDNDLRTQCPMGCTQNMIPTSLTAREEHARTLSQVGIGFWVTGGAIAAAAGVMAVLNRPRPADEHRPDIAVIATPSFVGATLSLTFR